MQAGGHCGPRWHLNTRCSKIQGEGSGVSALSLGKSQARFWVRVEVEATVDDINLHDLKDP